MELNMIQELATLNINENDQCKCRFMWNQIGASKSGYPKTETSWSGDGWSAKYGREEQWRVFAYHQRSEEYNEPWYDNMPFVVTPRKCEWIPSEWRMLLQLFQNSLISLGHKEWITANLKTSWSIYNPSAEVIFVIQKFTG
jgi:hypothetical protein